MPCGFTTGINNKFKRSQKIVMDYYNENRDKFYEYLTLLKIW